MALVVARDVPTSSATMAVPHGPESVSTARRRLRKDLAAQHLPDVVIDDAVLILSELLSNACRHARPLEPVLWCLVRSFAFTSTQSWNRTSASTRLNSMP